MEILTSILRQEEKNKSMRTGGAKTKYVIIHKQCDGKLRKSKKNLQDDY